MARVEYGGILTDGRQTGSTLQCCHCGAHWEYKPGSGTLRGWCRKCSAPTCGNWGCSAECVPLGARLDHAEGTKTKYDDTINGLLAKGAVLLTALLMFAGAAFSQNPNTAVYPGATAGDKDLGVHLNHVQTTLAGNISSVATTAPVNSCTGFKNFSWVAIGSEVLMNCGCSAGTMSFGRSSCPNVDGRGLDGTSAASHSNGDGVFAYIVAGSFNQPDAEIEALESNLSTPSAIRTKTCILAFGDPGASSPALAADNNAPAVCGNTLGINWVIKAVSCKANAGSSSVNPVLTGGNSTSILSAPITCGTAGFTAGSLGPSPTVHSFSADGATCVSTPCTIDANLNTVDGVTKYIVLIISGSY